MTDQQPLALLEFAVVIAFVLVYLVVDRVAKRAARKYAAREKEED